MRLDLREGGPLHATTVAAATDSSQQLRSRQWSKRRLCNSTPTTISLTRPLRHTSANRDPWPEISGSKQDLNRALEHLLAVAESNDIRVQYTDDNKFTEVGMYRHDERSITLHADLGHTPGLYAFVLAHELAHAFDPILHATEMPDYGTQKADIEP